MTLPTTRAEAKTLGAKHYFTGLPCPRGHIAPRFTSVGTCTACGRERAMEKHVHTSDKRRAYSDGASFAAAASVLHNGVYLYDAGQYQGAHTLTPITCMTHGVFMQSPTNHMQGKGCPKCADARSSAAQLKPAQEFFAQATKMWRGVFDYSDSIYVGARKALEFRCVVHGVIVSQTPSNHLTGRNPCPKCNHMKSAGEDAVFNLVSNYARAAQRDRTILKPKELDIFLPEQKLAIEYCGMFWHSHGDAADEKSKKRNHYEKYQACAEQDIRLITLYETEWEERKYAIRRLLRNAVGKSRGKLMARKCELRKVDAAEARAFYERYHPQGGAGSGEHYALFWKGKMVACMRFVFGANDRGAGASKRVWTLGRYATRITVSGAASKLFKAFIKDFNPTEVKSFSDNRFFDGRMYSQLGFELEADVPPDYQVWSPKIGLRPKSHYQRRLLPKRLEEHGLDPSSFNPDTDSRTEAEVTYAMRARRIYDCGKKRWVWTAK